MKPQDNVVVVKIDAESLTDASEVSLTAMIFPQPPEIHKYCNADLFRQSKS